MTREERERRDKDRPIIVQCIGILVQQATTCDDDEAIHAAWNIYEYIGEPTRLPPASLPPVELPSED